MAEFSKPNDWGQTPPMHGSRRLKQNDWLGTVVLVHLGGLIIGTSWLFGGMAPVGREFIRIWGGLGLLVFFVANWVIARREHRSFLMPFVHLWPLVVLDALVVLSCFNPTFQQFMRDGEYYLQMVAPPHTQWPSCARPDLAWPLLWQLNVIIISCYNAFLALQRRRILRALLFLIGSNAVILGIFGTFQKLVGAEGIWLGAVKTRQNYFFSTFVYHNHWGAFILLCLAACLGLFFHALRRGGHRDIWHSPALGGALALLLLAITAPLSGSRSTTMLVTLLLGCGLVHLLVRLINRRRERHESAFLPVAGIILSAVIGVAAIFWLGRDVIMHRAQLTSQQLTSIRNEDQLNSRLHLYRDTWRVAQEKPWFGWGLGSYPDVFRVYNSQRTAERWVPYYKNAHNDWLQALAEIGFAGTGLLGLLIVLPLVRAPWGRIVSAIPRYLLASCGLVLLYAWVEFPFANPSVLIAFWCSLYVAARYARLDLGVQASHPSSSSHA